MAAWLGATTLGLANAGVRELGYADRVGELAAHQISTATLLAALAARARTARSSLVNMSVVITRRCSALTARQGVTKFLVPVAEASG
jgi:hypothetical protein